MPDNLAPIASRSGGGTLAGALGEAEADIREEDVEAQQQYDELERTDAIESAVTRASISAGRFTLFGEDGDLDTSSLHTNSMAHTSNASDSQPPGEIAAAARSLTGIERDASALSLSDSTTSVPRPIGPSSRDAPVCCIVIGMAGSGKTTLMQRINAEAHMSGTPSYIVNLDPAVTHLPYGPNIDIRDTVNYKEVRPPPSCSIVCGCGNACFAGILMLLLLFGASPVLCTHTHRS